MVIDLSFGRRSCHDIADATASGVRGVPKRGPSTTARGSTDRPGATCDSLVASIGPQGQSGKVAAPPRTVIIHSMRRPRVYCPALATGPIALPSEESHHLRTVLRAEPGTEVIVFDGKGTEADGVIARVDRRGVVVEARDLRNRPFDLAVRVTLAVALGKPHRQTYLVEKCTELGVAAIWPILSERSLNKPGASTVERMSRRAIEAAKQSGRAWVPAIENTQPLAESVKRVGEFQSTAMADVEEQEGTPVAGVTLLPFHRFLSGLPEWASILVWVGPEGGWSAAERTLLRTSGAVSVTLSPTTLRSETAAVAVCAAAALMHAGSGLQT